MADQKTQQARERALEQLLKQFSSSMHFSRIDKMMQSEERACCRRIATLKRELAEVNGELRRILRANAWASLSGFVGVQAALTAATAGLGAAVGNRLVAVVLKGQDMKDWGVQFSAAIVKMMGMFFPAFTSAIGQAAYNNQLQSHNVPRIFGMAMLDIVMAPSSTAGILSLGTVYSKLILVYNTLSEQFVVDPRKGYTQKAIAKAHQQIARLPDKKILGWWFRTIPNLRSGTANGNWVKLVRALLCRRASYEILLYASRARLDAIRHFHKDFASFARQMQEGKSLREVVRGSASAATWSDVRKVGSGNDMVILQKNSKDPTQLRVIVVASTRRTWERLRGLGITSGWSQGDFGRAGNFIFTVCKPRTTAKPPRPTPPDPNRPRPQLQRAR